MVGDSARAGTGKRGRNTIGYYSQHSIVPPRVVGLGKERKEGREKTKTEGEPSPVPGTQMVSLERTPNTSALLIAGTIPQSILSI